jgi:hypothetical protein
MKIATGMLKEYLNYIAAIALDQGGAPDDINEYFQYVLWMKELAIEKGDLEPLHLGIDYLLTHPEVDASSYARIHYFYDKDEIEELLLYIRAIVWSDAPPPNPAEVRDVELLPLSVSDWWNNRKQPVSP